ncbi:MAG: DUF58 domain-containing protein [Clostridia bacterium]|nr:DUF58 domain-containing protein [Clostridia bacterium]
MRRRTVNFLAAAATIAVIALTLGSRLLLMGAVCMGLMLILALVSLLPALATLDVTSSQSGERVRRGEEIRLKLFFSFKGILPIGSAAYQADAGMSARFGGAPFCRYERQCVLPAAHVGVFNAGEGRVYITDVFNLFVFSRKISAGSVSYTVLPMGFETERPEHSLRESGSGEVHLSDDANEPAGVREWIKGDALKRVHWKLSTRYVDPYTSAFKPYVKTYEEAARPEVLVLPVTAGLFGNDEETLNRKDGVCECALSVCRACLKAGESVRLLGLNEGSNEIFAASEDDVPRMEDMLAHIAAAGDTQLKTAVSEVMRRSQTTSAAVLVASALNGGEADMLVRLRMYSSLGVSLVYVRGVPGENDETLSRLDAAGVSVSVYALEAEDDETA